MTQEPTAPPIHTGIPLPQGAGRAVVPLGEPWLRGFSAAMTRRVESAGRVKALPPAWLLPDPAGSEAVPEDVFEPPEVFAEPPVTDLPTGSGSPPPDRPGVREEEGLGRPPDLSMGVELPATPADVLPRSPEEAARRWDRPARTEEGPVRPAAAPTDPPSTTPVASPMEGHPREDARPRLPGTLRAESPPRTPQIPSGEDREPPTVDPLPDPQRVGSTPVGASVRPPQPRGSRTEPEDGIPGRAPEAPSPPARVPSSTRATPRPVTRSSGRSHPESAPAVPTAAVPTVAALPREAMGGSSASPETAPAERFLTLRLAAAHRRRTADGAPRRRVHIGTLVVTVQPPPAPSHRAPAAPAGEGVTPPPAGPPQPVTAPAAPEISFDYPDPWADTFFD